MSRIPQESFAWRNQSFDTELPERALAELVARERPRIPGRKTPAALKPAVTWPLYLALLIVALVIGGAANNLLRQWDAERAKTSKAILQPTPAPTPAPTPELS